MKYAITYHKVNGSIPCYLVKVQDTYNYRYVKDIEVYDVENIDGVISKIKEEYPDSYTCEMVY